MTRERGNAPDASQHRLHNCGPVSREVFRTPAIGELVTFDLRRTLLGWAKRRAGLGMPDGWTDGAVPLPAAVIAAATSRVLSVLGIEPPPHGAGTDAGHARRCLGALVGLLEEAGLLRDLVGIAFHTVRAAEAPADPARSTSTEELARALAVYAVYVPPLLLWTRTPSLRWFRGDTLITLRRFEVPASRRSGE
jgi:hypothetical protein